MTRSVPKLPGVHLLGAHFSIAGGLDRALFTASAYGCDSLQIFTKNARAWKEKNPTQADIDDFKTAKIHTGITSIASHTSYLINLATPDPGRREQSINALSCELDRCTRLGIGLTVLHPGSHLGSGRDTGIRQIADSLRRVLDSTDCSRTRLLLETTSGQGTGLGYTFEQLAEILDRAGHEQALGVCLDTCHMFAAGYDLRTETAYGKTMATLDSCIGMSRIFMIHLNDSKRELGSGIDRHDHIGQGHIGSMGFSMIMNDSRFSDLPKIIETPKISGTIDMDRRNLDVLKQMAGHTSDSIDI